MTRGVNDIIVATSIIANNTTPHEYLQESLTEDADYSLLRKMIEYYETFQEFKKSPIWGLGLGHQYLKLWNKEGEQEKEGAYVHSVYSYFLMDTGLIGICLFILLLIRTFRTLINAFKDESNDSTMRSVMLGSAISVIALSINSFNGSFLLLIPYILFISVFSALASNTNSTQHVNP
jgi:O-antigen ligase